jgi:opacity protein-like surface antigen
MTVNRRVVPFFSATKRSSMKKLVIVSLLAAVCAAPAFARDDIVKITLQSVLDMPEAQGKLDGSVRFFLAGSPTPRIAKKLGEDVSNQKTNAFNKTAEQSCRWAALSALIAFQNHAKQQGANAVVDLVSYYKKEVVSSPTDIDCHNGAFIGGVALKGTYATVGK